MTFLKFQSLLIMLCRCSNFQTFENLKRFRGIWNVRKRFYMKPLSRNKSSHRVQWWIRAECQQIFFINICRIELSGKQSTISDRSKLIEKLLQDGQLGEASRMTRDMLISGTHPIARVLKFLMIQLAKAGDVETITFCTKYLSDVSFSCILLYY